jgi:hypothetical protein
MLAGTASQVSPRSKRALMDAVSAQPVTAYFYVDSSFQSYKTGIYNSTTCLAGYGTYPNIRINHVFVIIGYNITDPANPYWIIQVSLGIPPFAHFFKNHNIHLTKWMILSWTTEQLG